MGMLHRLKSEYVELQDEKSKMYTFVTIKCNFMVYDRIRTSELLLYSNLNLAEIIDKPNHRTLAFHQLYFLVLNFYVSPMRSS